MTTHDSLKKEFVKILKQMAPHRHPWDTFRDWLEIAAITLHQIPYHSGELERDEIFEQYEAQYMEAIKRYKPAELTEFAKLIGITISALSTDFDDFLGAIASEQEWLNEDAGQFFTPYHLCRAIAKMTLGDIKAHLQEKGTPITVSEPACGGGALVIACAHEAYEQGVDPRAHFVFDCQDVSRNSFNMTYIQLSAIGLQAVVHHGNTLSMEIWEHRVTMQHRLYLNWLKEQCQIQRLEMMRDLIVNPALLLEEQAAQSEQYEGASAQPDTEETPTAPKTETEQPQGQLSIFDAETEISAAPAETAKPQKSKPAIQLPPPEQRQLGLFDGQKQAGK